MIVSLLALTAGIVVYSVVPAGSQPPKTEVQWAQDPFWRFLQRGMVVYRRGLRMDDLDYLLSNRQSPLFLEDHVFSVLTPAVPTAMAPALTPMLVIHDQISNLLEKYPLAWTLKGGMSHSNPKLNLNLEFSF